MYHAVTHWYALPIDPNFASRAGVKKGAQSGATCPHADVGLRRIGLAFKFLYNTNVTCRIRASWGMTPDSTATY